MPSHAMLRLADSFFRRPVLCLLPLVLFAVLGGVYVSDLDDEYRAHGVILVEDRTFLSSLTGVRGAEGGYLTPATQTSNQLNSMLQTDAFLAAVVERADLADPATLTADDYQRLRTSIGSWEAGQNLVHVWASDAQPDVAHQLADATVKSLIQWQIDAEVDQSATAEGFLAPLTERYREDLAAARDALESYLRANPEPEEGERSASQQTVVDGLTADVSEASARYIDTVAKEESARLATAQAESDVRNRLQLFDPPKVPVAPSSKLKTAALIMAAFLGSGALLSAAAVVAGAVVDQSLRFPADVSRRLGIEVLAVLPDASRWTPPVEEGRR